MHTRNSVLELLKNIYEESEAKAIYKLLEEGWETKILNENTEDIACLKRLLSEHTPIQYILGQSYFYDDIIFLNGHTLIPRPETEELVHWILNDHHDLTNMVWDIGTGSGCIPITLAKKNFINVIATDINPLALDNLDHNARHYNVNIKSALHDILKDEITDYNEVKILVSNPPYIAAFEEQSMEDNVLRHEPKNALFPPNEDPLLFYKRIAFIAEQLTQIEYIYLEINPLFAQETVDLFNNQNWKVDLKKDMQGKNRMIKCVRISPKI